MTKKHDDQAVVQDNDKDLEDLQKMLGVGRNLAYKLINEKKIEHIKINNRIFIPKQNIIKFLFANEVKNER